MGSLCLENSANTVQACGAGALQAIVAALRTHSADAAVQFAACGALVGMLDAQPRLQATVGAAGAVSALVDAMRLPAADARLMLLSCVALKSLVERHRGNAERACEAGVIEAVAAAMRSSCAHEDHDELTVRRLSVYECALSMLLALLLNGGTSTALRAVHAGVLDTMAQVRMEHVDPSVLAIHARVTASLQAAAQEHDTGACAHDGCKRCATARHAGCMRALAGCGARKRGDDSGKGLLRCGACRTAAYCGAAHQRADYARHKTERAALGAASASGSAA
jgi:hypothetical protein